MDELSDINTPSGSQQTGSNDDGKEINILLVGESGVGKSTFINSCFNYLQFSSLREVLEKELQVLIPAKIHYEDVNMDEQVWELPISKKYFDPDDLQNEQFKDAEAATQDVRMYVFCIYVDGQKHKIRLIDTPGMGDSRGVKQDQENCSKILAYLSQLKELHGICILLKPTSSRLDFLLSYCMVQILSRLDSSAVNNVCFVFTNTKGYNYSAGHTSTPLKVLLKKIKEKNGITIPLNRDNRFHFDNEAFSYVAAVKHGVEVDPSIYGSTEISWNKSANEFWRLLSYVTQLKPHDLKKTISINDALAMTKNLSEPVTEILQLIQLNEGKLRQHTADLLDVKLSNKEMIEKMNQPFYDIKIEELEYPHTVCTDRNCTTVRVVNGIRKTHYKNKCCEQCWSTFVSPEIVGNVALYTCTAFNWDATCKKCGHYLVTHKHIYYETEVYERKIDESFLPTVSSQEELMKLKESLIQNVEERIKDLHQKKQYVLQCGVVFDRYLKQNSMASIGNPIEDYLKYQLTSERTFQQDPNDETVQLLQKLLAEYESEKSRFQAAGSSETWNITADEIEERKQKLLCMGDFGPRIEKLYNLHKAGMNKEFKKREKKLRGGPKGWFKQFKDLIGFGVQAGQAVMALEHGDQAGQAVMALEQF